MKRGIILAAIWLTSAAAFSDLGIGVSVQGSDSRILVPYNVSETFRVEPSFSYYRIEQEDSYDYDYTEIGAGFFHRKSTAENMSFLLGARVGYLNSSREYTSSFDVLDDESDNGYFIAPTLGLEYFLGDAFSVAAEISLRHDSVLLGNSGTKATRTDSALIARFYL